MIRIGARRREGEPLVTRRTRCARCAGGAARGGAPALEAGAALVHDAAMESTVRRFSVPIRPRYGEVDAMGVVYHGHYLAYFDVGRTERMRALGCPYAALEARGYRLAVVDVGVRYRSPARYDEDLSLAVAITHVGGATVAFAYELQRAASVLASGHTRLGCLDPSNRPTRLPADAFAALRRGMDEDQEASKAS